MPRLIDADAFAEFVEEYLLPKSPDGFVIKLSVLAALHYKSITPTINKNNNVHTNDWISVKDTEGGEQDGQLQRFDGDEVRATDCPRNCRKR